MFVTILEIKFQHNLNLFKPMQYEFKSNESQRAVVIIVRVA